MLNIILNGFDPVKPIIAAMEESDQAMEIYDILYIKHWPVRR